MAILNTSSSEFILEFPRSFFYTEVKNKWNRKLKEYDYIYDDITDYISAMVQSVSFPEYGMDGAVEQSRNLRTYTYKNSKHPKELLDKSFSVTFRHVETKISYWIMFDQIQQYFNFSPNLKYFPLIFLHFLDEDSNVVYTIIFKDVRLGTISSFELSKADLQPTFNTFDVSFFFNDYEIKIFD
jgi:hypothetical protein